MRMGICIGLKCVPPGGGIRAVSVGFRVGIDLGFVFICGFLNSIFGRVRVRVGICTGLKYVPPGGGTRAVPVGIYVGTDLEAVGAGFPRPAVCSKRYDNPMRKRTRAIFRGKSIKTLSKIGKNGYTMGNALKSEGMI